MVSKKSVVLTFLVLVILCGTGVISMLVQADYIYAQVTFTPDQIALDSNHRFFVANITLPNPHNVEDISVDSVTLENVISPTAWGLATTSVLYTPIAVYDKCGQYQESGNGAAEAAIDGLVGWAWKHYEEEHHWIIFDMGETVSVSRLRIYQSTVLIHVWGGRDGIEVYVSNDTSNWRFVWNRTLLSPGWQYTQAFSALCRYIKLYSRSTGKYQRLVEVQAEVIISVDGLLLRFDGVTVMDYIRSIVSHEDLLDGSTEVELTFTGKLLDGTPFTGEDTVMVT